MAEEWSAAELADFTSEDELFIETRREDGSMVPAVPIWMVVVDGHLYVRTWKVRSTGWYGRAVRYGTATPSTAPTAVGTAGTAPPPWTRSSPTTESPPPCGSHRRAEWDLSSQVRQRHDRAVRGQCSLRPRSGDSDEHRSPTHRQRQRT
ncbi:DUF2255 family protein [Gordonia sp. (in: high G+C Gram-positive bacteria)]|uniref:DUF2255 family protein n=1 Tax=Gordonia sp. (in: high G+C Gram-positive bacteria) TaxID=84139 RepID=UPI0039E48CD7